MIKVAGVSKNYKQVRALSAVDLEFKQGCVTGLLGPNGCGKTTLIKSILGLVIPDVGSISVGGQCIQKNWSYRADIGYMPQNSQFPGNLKSFEVFNMVEDIQQKKAIYKEELIDLFDVRKQMKKPISQLSGGTRQKISAILAFMFDPKILILDEPTVGLDPVAVMRLKKLISSAAHNGKAVVLVTHMLAEIEQLVSEMYFMLDGKIKFSGPLVEIRNRAGGIALEEAVVKLMSENYQIEERP